MLSFYGGKRPANPAVMHFSRVSIITKRGSDSDWSAGLVCECHYINFLLHRWFSTAWKLFSCFMNKSSFDRNATFLHDVYQFSFYLLPWSRIDISLHLLIEVSECCFDGVNLCYYCNLTLSFNKLDSMRYFLFQLQDMKWNKMRGNCAIWGLHSINQISYSTSCECPPVPERWFLLAVLDVMCRQGMAQALSPAEGRSHCLPTRVLAYWKKTHGINFSPVISASSLIPALKKGTGRWSVLR